MKLLLHLLVLSFVSSLIFTWTIDFCVKDNAKNHNTDKFKDSNDTLIVRRQQPVKIHIRNIHPKWKVGHIFHRYYGTSNKKMEECFIMNPDLLVEKTKEYVTFKGIVEIGKYKWTVKLYNGSKLVGKRSQVLYVLFNPWSPLENVFMPDKSDLDEYILQDEATMYYGSNFARKWTFAQFEKGMLDIVLNVVNKASDDLKNNPITVSRAVSAIANSYTDGGIVEGRWGKNYDDGIYPMDWTSSLPLLKEYNKTGKPVKYGQCYVFAGIVTTILRAIGIPTRSITTYGSAVDKNRNILIDDCVDENGKYYAKGFCGDDFNWNYHVWNEVWLRKADYPESNYYSHNGWHVVDGTPSVVNDGRYQIGPAPISAVKSGKTNVKYDTDFVFAEVSAPGVLWLVDSKTGETKKVLRVNYQKSGDRVVRYDSRQPKQLDITSDYKFSKKSLQRHALIRALINQGTDLSIINENDPFKKLISFVPSVDPTVQFGKSITFTIRSESSTTMVKVLLKFTAEAASQGSQSWKHINTINYNLTLQPYGSYGVSWDLPAESYAKEGAPDQVAITVLAHIEGQDDVWGTRELVRVVNPSLQLDNLDGLMYLSTRSCLVKVSFTNPLPTDLHNCRLSLSGNNGIEKISVGTIQAKDQFATHVDNSPEKSLIAVILNCDEMRGAAASLSSCT